tara:strand:+ start:268 stop:540 length:273 start_codon:yes stop_codon:yes gene_type:complete
MNRKQRRALSKITNKDSSKQLSDKVTQFGNLPDKCLTCEKPFDKKNKKMVKTWSVVVKDEETVRLYCPECWKMANQVINEWRKEIENVRK